MKMSKGNIYIISGPSGSGKDTILKEVLKVKKDVFFSISHITRAMRTGEVEGEKYHFISREEFEQQLANNMFLEYNEYSGNYYGTPKAPIEQHLAAGDDVLIECDVNGAEALRKLLPGALSVFIMPPSFEVLKKRLVGRGTETAEQVEKRMKEALNEIRRADEYDYIVVNDDLSLAVEDFITVLKSNKLLLKNQKYLIDEVLKNA
ncbi:MAG: guanylate kinase [Clostridia bacterium]|nr:guanylate kinase [Clostridia bacterium]MBQ7108546.1 guanylate kinase [Clostridia bacterium]